MIMLQPEAEVFDETARFSPDVCLRPLRAFSEPERVRFLFIHVHRP